MAGALRFVKLRPRCEKPRETLRCAAAPAQAVLCFGQSTASAGQTLSPRTQAACVVGVSDIGDGYLLNLIFRRRLKFGASFERSVSRCKAKFSQAAKKRGESLRALPSAFFFADSNARN